jgi:Concanavalin A-like lectin/glucanases superfamily
MIRALAIVACACALVGCDVEGGGLPNQPPTVRPTPEGPAADAQPIGIASVDARPPGDAAAADALAVAPGNAADAPPPPPPALDAAPPPPPPPVDASPAPPPVSPPPPDAAPPGNPAGTCPRDPAVSICLRFEGSIVDESPHALRLTSSNVRFEPGPWGMAASLGPTSSIHVDETTLLDGDAITIEASLAPRVLPGASLRQGIADSPGQYGMFLLPPADVACLAGTARAVAPNVLKVGAWVRATCTFAPRSISVFIDGRRVSETATPMGPSQSGNGGLTIGLNNPSGENFQGLLDNFRLSRAASAPDGP